VHRVMECFQFQKLLAVDRTSDEAVETLAIEEITRMKERALITAEMVELVQLEKIVEFLKKPVAHRMAEADARGDLFREKPFVMDYEGVLLQGIIDVFWLEGNKIVLLDYKTDRVSQAEELITRYGKQLELYADALCRVFSTEEWQIQDTENLIYSFRLNETITL